MPAPTPATAPAGAPAHWCPLCGFRFDEGVSKCGSCPLHEGCETACCPRCGYTFADRSATLEALRKVGRSLGRLLRPRRSGGEGGG